MAKNDVWALDLDFDELDSEGPKALDEGVFEFEIVKAEPTVSKGQEPKPMISLQLLALSDSNGVKFDDKRTVYDNIVLTANAAFRAKQIAEATKMDVSKLRLKTEEDVKDFCEDLVGAICFGRVKHEEYNGRTNARVEKYLAELPQDESEGGGRRRRRPAADEAPASKAKEEPPARSRRTRGEQAKEEPEEEPPAKEEPPARRRPSSRR